MRDVGQEERWEVRENERERGGRGIGKIEK